MGLDLAQFRAQSCPICDSIGPNPRLNLAQVRAQLAQLKAHTHIQRERERERERERAQGLSQLSSGLDMAQHGVILAQLMAQSGLLRVSFLPKFVPYWTAVQNGSRV